MSTKIIDLEIYRARRTFERARIVLAESARLLVLAEQSASFFRPSPNIRSRDRFGATRGAR